MAQLIPFRALRPDPVQASRVAAVPYDVVNRSEAKALADGNPLSFLHISRPEIDLADSVAADSDCVYEKGLNNFKKLIRDCPLIREPEPSLYIYRLKMGSHIQTGIAGCFSLQEYENGTIRKHEKTRQDKETDRTRHIETLNAQTGPAFLAYRDQPRIKVEVESQKQGSPLYQFQATDGVEHTIWKVSDPKVLVSLFEESVPCLYIADGHHRAAAAARAYKEAARAAPPDKSRNTAAGGFLAVAFPASELQILPYHRGIRDLNGLSENEFLEKVSEKFRVDSGSGKVPPRNQFGMFLGDQWYSLCPKETPRQEILDVDLLQDWILRPVLGIHDPRTDRRIDFVGGIRGTMELETRVKSGEFNVAFTLHPTVIDQVMNTSDQNLIMPPKSTWFEPKLRDGLLSHVLD